MALLDLVIAKVKDESGRLDYGEDYMPAVAAALQTYSSHRPLNLVEDMPGDGTHTVPLPDGWQDGFSSLLQVEYPIGNVPKTLQPLERVELYHTPSGLSLVLYDVTPEADEDVRVSYTVERLESTMLNADEDAVASLAASYCCEVLANLTAQTNDPTIEADVVNYRSKSSEFERRAKRLSGIYHRHMGIDPEGPSPAGIVVAAAPDSGRGRLTH